MTELIDRLEEILLAATATGEALEGWQIMTSLHDGLADKSIYIRGDGEDIKTEANPLEYVEAQVTFLILKHIGKHNPATMKRHDYQTTAETGGRALRGVFYGNLTLVTAGDPGGLLKCARDLRFTRSQPTATTLKQGWFAGNELTMKVKYLYRDGGINKQ